MSDAPTIQISEDGLTIRWGNKAILIIMDDGVGYCISTDDHFTRGTYEIRFDDGGVSLAAAMKELKQATMPVSAEAPTV